jgi:ketol-acid reductoisomerase
MKDNGINVIVGQSKEFKDDWDRAVSDGWEPGNDYHDVGF